jgi:hypothetical protein
MLTHFTLFQDFKESRHKVFGSTEVSHYQKPSEELDELY